MFKHLLALLILLVLPVALYAQELAEAEEQAPPAATEAAQDDALPETKTMSGMSILGNEEAPKSLVIIPWKASEIGVDLSLSESLGSRARPVDREVFMRELAFYEIRSGDAEE